MKGAIVRHKLKTGEIIGHDGKKKKVLGNKGPSSGEYFSDIGGFFRVDDRAMRITGSMSSGFEEEAIEREIIIRLTRPDSTLVTQATLSYISFYAVHNILEGENPFLNPVYLYDAINPDNVYSYGDPPVFEDDAIKIDATTFVDKGVNTYWMFYNTREAGKAYQDGVRIQYPSRYKAADLWNPFDKITAEGEYEDVVPYGRFHLKIRGQYSEVLFDNSDMQNVCLYFELYTPGRNMIMFSKEFREDLGDCWDLMLPGVTERPTEDYPRSLGVYTAGTPVKDITAAWIAYMTFHSERQYHRMATQHPLKYLWDDLWKEDDMLWPGPDIIEARMCEYCELKRTEGGDDDPENRFTFSCFDFAGLDDGLAGTPYAGKYEHERVIAAVPTADQNPTFRCEYITGNALCTTGRNFTPLICNNFCDGAGFGKYESGVQQPACVVFDEDYIPLSVPPNTGDSPIAIATLGGVGPMMWQLTPLEGQSGWSLEEWITNSGSYLYQKAGHGQTRNWIHTENACGSARLTVRDSCGSEIETIIKSTDGQWSEVCKSPKYSTCWPYASGQNYVWSDHYQENELYKLKIGIGCLYSFGACGSPNVYGCVYRGCTDAEGKQWLPWIPPGTYCYYQLVTPGMCMDCYSRVPPLKHNCCPDYYLGCEWPLAVLEVYKWTC